MSDQYTLYGAQMSLYTGKVRAYLQYKNVPYKEVFSSLSVYKKTLIPHTGVKVIPVVRTPENEYLQDTSYIIDVLEQRIPPRSVTPTSPRQAMVSSLIEMWADEWLLIPAMHYRWNKHNTPFIYQEFGRVVLPSMPAWLRAIAGKKLAKRFQGFVPMLGITDKTIDAIEYWYEHHVLRLLDLHFAKHDYLLGSRPCLGDFGLFGPLYAHLFRDPVPGKIMRALAPNVVAWIQRMNQPVKTVGQWLPDDEIPQTVDLLLRRQFEEFWPVLERTVQAADKWAKEHDKQQAIPRGIGSVAFTIGKSSGTRVAFSHHLWKLQRLLALFQTLSAAQQQVVRDYLKDMGANHWLDMQIANPVVRNNNRLYFS